jgi:ribosomal-protein-alanine N-acetyltransferase
VFASGRGAFAPGCAITRGEIEQAGIGARVAVERVADGVVLGWCGLSRWNRDYRSAALGYCYDDAASARGYATESAHALLQWAFDAHDLNRVQAETDTRNAAAAYVLGRVRRRPSTTQTPTLVG